MTIIARREKKMKMQGKKEFIGVLQTWREELLTCVT
jgi:hypothetical protein